MENQNYCVRCGGELPSDATKCPHCGKTLPAKDRLFRRFLIDHTKDQLKGKLEDSLFEAIKNYLLSHLFGMLVGLLVIAVGCVAIFAPSPYDHIRMVDSVEELRGGASAPAEKTVSDADRAQIEEMLGKFVACLDLAHFQAGTDVYNYCVSDTLYEQLNKDVDESLLATYYDEFPFIDIDDYPSNRVTVHGMTCGSDTKNGQWLTANGYDVVEVTLTHALYAVNQDPDTPQATADYLVTVTKENGAWVVVDTIKKEV